MSKPKTRQTQKPQSQPKPATLDPRPARQLTTRECARLIGGTVGCLCGMAALEDVATALRWWADHLDVLPMLAQKAAQREPDAVKGTNGKA